MNSVLPNESLTAEPKPVEHLWRAFRFESDGIYENIHCPVQTWKCEHCQTKLDAPDGQDPKNYEQTDCAGLQSQSTQKEKWRASINGK
jgi:hypothetical protein